MMTTSRSTGSRRRRPPWRTARRPRGVPALGYASASAGTALDGPETEAQRLEIESACHGLGLELVDLVRDHEPDEAGADGRPGLSYAPERVDAGEASCLIVSDLERLSRQVPELAAVVDRLERARVRLIAIDVGLDTATPTGRLAVSRRRGADTVAEVAAEKEEAAEEAAPSSPVRQAPDRAGLSYLIERLATGDASCILVTGLERLSRSVAELGTIVQWLERNSVRLVAVNLDLDTASPGGQ